MAFIAAALPYLAAAGSAVSALGQLRAGQAQQGVQDYNAEVSSIKATQATQQATATAAQQAIETRQQIAQQASAYAAGGVDLSGSPLAVMMSTATQGELKKQLTIWQGNTQAASDNMQGTLDTAAGTAAASAGATAAGSTLLTGATKFLGPSGINVAGTPLKTG